MAIFKIETAQALKNDFKSKNIAPARVASNQTAIESFENILADAVRRANNAY